MRQIIVFQTLALYNASQAGITRAKGLPALPSDEMVAQDEAMLLVREQETQRVAREDADFQKKMSEQAEIAQQRALKYEQEVAALQQRIREKKAQQNTAALNAIGNLITTVVTQSQAKTSPSVQQTPNTSSRPQTTQSGNTNSPSSPNGNNSRAASQNDPDFPAAMKGGLYTSQSAPSYNCVNDSYGTKLQRCWGDWTTDGNYPQIQYSGLGPIQSATNAVDDTPGKKSQAWHIRLKNTSNSIVELKLDVIYGDGKKTWVYFAIPPDETVYKSDYYTLSAAETVGIGVARLRSCSNFTRVQNGYRCEE